MPMHHHVIDLAITQLQRPPAAATIRRYLTTRHVYLKNDDLQKTNPDDHLGIWTDTIM